MSDRRNVIAADTGLRIDLHCHSLASIHNAGASPATFARYESSTSPDEAFRIARGRGMRFFTLTDYDTLSGIVQLASHPDVILGEELRTRFPEDGVPVNLLVWGLRGADHESLRGIRHDVYQVASYLADERIPHAVTRVVGRRSPFGRDHLDRLVLLFKGFECVNAMDPSLCQLHPLLLDDLTPARIERLARACRLSPLWPEPHIKARTGGSNAHGLELIARSWTEFPSTVVTREDVLECLRRGDCRPGGLGAPWLNLPMSA